MKLEFKKTQIPAHISVSDWYDWKWQIRNRLQSHSEFSKYLSLTPEEIQTLEGAASLFKVQSTPYYTSLGSLHGVQDPVRRMLVPSHFETVSNGQQMPDPLGERRHSPTGRVIHRYPDRVLFLVTDTCSVYCRYCLRKYFTGSDEAFIQSEDYQKALQYLRANTGIREVILSGGDPLTLSDQRLLRILEDLKAIDHIELIRIGSRMSVVCPMRITPDLVKELKKFHPIYMMVHFNHPQELSEEAAEALTLLVDNGFPVFNQMVLLRGINNHAAIVQALSRRLLRLRVKPYYMFQCDPSEGTEHFRTTIEESMKIQRELWGTMSGLAMPHLSLDIPGGGGKVGLVPDFTESRSEDRWLFKGWDGYQAEYINPTGEIQLPHIEPYIEEWMQTQKQRYGQ